MAHLVAYRQQLDYLRSLSDQLENHYASLVSNVPATSTVTELKALLPNLTTLRENLTQLFTQYPMTKVTSGFQANDGDQVLMVGENGGYFPVSTVRTFPDMRVDGQPYIEYTIGPNETYPYARPIIWRPKFGKWQGYDRRTENPNDGWDLYV